MAILHHLYFQGNSISTYNMQYSCLFDSSAWAQLVFYLEETVLISASQQFVPYVSIILVFPLLRQTNSHMLGNSLSSARIQGATAILAKSNLIPWFSKQQLNQTLFFPFKHKSIQWERNRAQKMYKSIHDITIILCTVPFEFHIQPLYIEVKLLWVIEGN